MSRCLVEHSLGGVFGHAVVFHLHDGFMQFWIKAALILLSNPTTPARIMIGVILATNMAKTCCNPKGTAFARGTRPSNS